MGLLLKQPLNFPSYGAPMHGALSLPECFVRFSSEPEQLQETPTCLRRAVTHAGGVQVQFLHARVALEARGDRLPKPQATSSNIPQPAVFGTYFRQAISGGMNPG